MAPKFALFTKGSKLPLNQGFQNGFLVTTVSHQAVDMIFDGFTDFILKFDKQFLLFRRFQHNHVRSLDNFQPFPTNNKSAADNFENILEKVWTPSLNDITIIK